MKNDISPVVEKIVFGNDSVVIRKCNGTVAGGRTLDVSEFEGENILAGHVIIKTAKGNYAPMPCQEATEAVGETPATPRGYKALPAGAKYVGVLYRSLSKKNPAASIMTAGVVNPDLTPYPMATILDAFKTACPHISFEQDEEA